MFVPRSVSRKPQNRKPAKLQRTVKCFLSKEKEIGEQNSTAGLREEERLSSKADRGEGGERERRGEGEEGGVEEGGGETGGEGEGRGGEGGGEAGGGDSSSEEEDRPVVSYSKHQRWPVVGEPVCVMCGKYGAYIVDETDNDVCSLECKAKHLWMLGKSVCGGGGQGKEEEGRRKETTQLQWRYTEHAAVASLSEAQVAALRTEMSIEVKGEGMPKPVVHFSYLPLPEKVSSNLEEAGYHTPTPVQMQTIPAALLSRDVLVCAPTGSGKTLSFLLPLIMHISLLDVDTRLQGSPRALILTPTRELCMQIEKQTKQLMLGVPAMRTALVIGGFSIPNQLHRLRSGVQVIIATPARLIKILENHAADIDLSHIQVFVVDEVDYLLHLGFESQVRSIEECLPRSRQNLMFSATIPPRIEKMSSEMMKNPLFISVGMPSALCESVKHTIVWVEESAKRKRLVAFLNDRKLFKPPAVVFVNSSKGALFLADAVNKSCTHLSAVGIHRDTPQERRTAILRDFLEGKYSVCVNTGVWARGLDLVNVQQVFVFDMPSTVRQFIHQIGRAGRLGCPGWAITFLNNENKSLFVELVDLLEPMGVQLPSQLLHSPHLALQREKRKRKQAQDANGSGSKVAKKERSFYDGERLIDLIKSVSRKE